jgi:hypothetical protein
MILYHGHLVRGFEVGTSKIPVLHQISQPS